MPKSFANRMALLFFASCCAAGLTLRLTADTAPSISAEEAWEKLQTAKENFHDLEPASLNPQEFDGFLKNYGQKAGALADQFKDYEQRYKNGPHSEEAWNQWMEFLNLASRGDPTRAAELEKAEQQSLADPKLEMSRRERIRYNQVERADDLKRREQLVRQVHADLKGQASYLCENLLEIAEFSDHPHSRELVEEVLKLTDGKVGLSDSRAQAQQLKARLDRIGHPLKLKFTALDGTDVDVEKLRGKVVLLEFWATWCPPCVSGIPKLKAAWEALHQKGFEVIALSYDTEREKLSRFVTNNGLPWPQFFAPEGKDAAIVQGLGQPGPPAYWLIDRDGVLADVNAEHDLEVKVKKLLTRNNRAEP